MNGRSAATAVALLCGLLACSTDDRAWELAGEPGLLLKVKNYYETRGLEEGGRCAAPLMEGVARTQVLSDNQDEIVVVLSYYYRDWVRDDDYDSRRPWRSMGFMPECRGFAERTFTIDKGQDGFTVAGMSGPQRR